MKGMKKYFCFMLTVICFLSCFTEAYAVSTQKQGTVDSYQPLHVAILMDASGSIKGAKRSDSSDPDLVSREAAKAFLNCIPSNKNQVTLYHYSDVCIQDKVLTSVDSQENIKQLSDALSGMKQCSGETHMLAAIQKANNYLQTHSSEEYKNVIVVFTDGAENGMLGENSKDSDIRDAVNKVLGDTGTVVYSVAFDYFDEEKKSHSISKNANGDVGYGKKILDEIADKTGGKVMETSLNAIDELDDQFIKIINDLCNIYPERIAEYDGDGKVHETEFEITDSVIEADIRISCDTLDAVNKARISLVGPPPENEKVDFSGGTASHNKKIWYSVDRLAVSIKILSPQIGKWKLTVSNIKSNSPVYINLIRQYNMSFDWDIHCSSGDLQKINLGENVGVEVKLKSDGKLVKSDYFYNLEDMEAYVFLTQGDDKFIDFSQYDSKQMLNDFTDVLKNREHTQFFKMESTGQSFRVDVPMENIGKNLIGVWVCSGNFYCYEDRTVNVTHTLASKNKEISDVELKYGEKKSIDDLVSYSNYDDVKIELIKGDGNIIGAMLENDSNSLLIEGKKTGSQEVVLRYTSNADKKQSFEKKFNAVVLNSSPTVPKAIDLEMVMGDTVTKNDILDDINDPDGDVLVISGVHSGNPGILDIQKDDSKIVIKANAVGEDKITIDVTDGYNTITKVINVTVKYPIWFYLVIATAVIVVIVIIILLLALKKNRSRRLHTNLCDISFETYNDDGEEETYELKYPVSLANIFEKKGKVNIFDVIESVISEDFNGAEDLRDYFENHKVKLEGFRNIFIIGNAKSSEPDRIKGKDVHVRLNVGRISYSNVIDVDTLSSERFEFRMDDNMGSAVLKFMFNAEQL